VLGKLLVQGSLNRLVGIAGQASIHLAELGDLGDVGVIRLLRILGLNLDGLLYDFAPSKARVPSSNAFLE
jgi:hypothetical protein